MKRTLIFVLVCVMVLLMAACGSNGSSNTAGNKNPGGTENSKNNSSKQVKLRYSWWGSDERNQAILAAIETYEKMHTNVKIEAEYSAFGSYYQKLLTELSGNTAPDIISVDYKWVQDLISKGKPMVNMNTMTDIIDMKFAEEQAGDGEYLLGLPISVNTLGLVYNKPMLEQAGIEIHDNWDWDTVLAEGAKLHQSDDSKYLMILSTNHYIYLLKSQMKQMTGNNIVLDDFTLGFERQDLVQVFDYFRQLLDNGVIPPFEESVQYGDANAEQIPGWLNGTYAMTPTSASKIMPIADASKFEIGVARYPIFKDPVNPGVITTPGMIISINNKSANIEEAAAFINWLLNDEEANLLIKDTIGLPAVQSATALLTEQKLVDEKIVNMVQTAMPFAGTAENAPSTNPQIDTILKEYVERLGFKQLTPEQAADGLIKDVNSKLEELKKN